MNVCVWIGVCWLVLSRSIVRLLVNKTPRYLNSFTWVKDSLPLQIGQSTGFLLRAMTSDSEVLILIPATLHSDANQFSECWRSQTDDAIRATSSAKSSDMILSPPNCNLPPWLCLKVLSMKIKNRIGDKQDCWWQYCCWWQTGLVTRRSPSGGQPPPGTSLTCCHVW